MNRDLSWPADDTASQMQSNWEKRLDALVRGDCSEDDLVEEISLLRQIAPDAPWNFVALLDQRYRRGLLPLGVYKSIESKITRRELATADYGVTVDMDTEIDSAIRLPARGAAPREAPATNPPVADEHESLPPAVGAGSILLNRYYLESRLGSGGMGTVFKARDRYRCDLPRDRQPVAVKVFHERIARHPEALAKMRREFHCAQALAHENIIKVYDLAQDGDVAFFTMEYLRGRLLCDVIAQLQPRKLSRPYAWAIIRAVGAGLTHAHAHNVVHGDLKPQNIMITDSGEVRLLDFGASSAPVSRRPRADLPPRPDFAQLTPAYASCELLDGQQAGPRDDIYALACLAYELLAGEHPFQQRRSSEARQLRLTPKRLPGIRRRQWRALAMGLSWTREDRSLPVRDWLARLDTRGAHEGPLPPVHELSKAIAPAQSLPQLKIAALAIGLLVFIVLWGLLYRAEFGGKAVPKQPALMTAAVMPEIARPETLNDPAPSAAKLALPPVQPKHPRADHLPSAAVKPSSIRIAAGSYRIGRGGNFAEIRILRSLGTTDDVGFEWWTESSTAKPGIDYVDPNRVTQSLPKGRRSASLFIRLVPNVSRKLPVQFYVVIGNPSGGASIGNVARASVVLPAR